MKMNEKQQVQPQDDSSSLGLNRDLKSLSLSGPTIDLPADKKRAIEESLKYIDKKAIVEEYFLQSLAFTTMDDREEEITAAHKATFDWIFNINEDNASDDIASHKSNNNLMSWLKSGHQHNVYWINGKAGSGKSTLMRYVYEHSKTTDQLKVWAAEKPLLCPRFFFWTSGTVEQKSASGLLRSLLHQLLQEMNEMIPWTFPEKWLKYQDTKTRIREPIVWSVKSLRSALLRFLKLSTGKAKICFFIDGLDELEGNQQELVDMLHSIVESSPDDFKACVSSRPWKVFEEAFVDIPQLKLQDLTRNDIWRFVNDSLDNDVKVRRILKTDTKSAEHLKTKITEGANGVFLWAKLAVKTLVEHVGPTETIKDLLERLDVLPTDLDDFFRHLLFDSRTKAELEEQSRILQIIQAREIVCDFTRHDSSNVVTLYQMVLANTGESLEYKDVPAKLPDEKILAQCQSTKEHLLDRCAGLLLVHQSKKGKANQNDTGTRFSEFDEVDVETLARGRIGYIHRTVRDFFVHSGGFDDIAKQTEHINYDPHICLLRSLVLQLRFPLEPPERHRRLDDWWPDVVLALTHARYANPTLIESQVELLNAFKTTLDWYWVPKKMDELDNWARNAFATFEQRMKHRTPYHYPYLSLATKFGLCDYLEFELDTGKYPYKGGIPILSYAVEYLASRRYSIYPFSSPKLVEMLLKKGEDPNLVYKNLGNKDETPWLLTLKYIREADRRGWIEANESDDGIKRWTMIVESFIQHGADPNALILKDNWDPSASALDILTTVDEKYQTPSFQKLLDLLIQHGATLRAPED